MDLPEGCALGATVLRTVSEASDGLYSGSSARSEGSRDMSAGSWLEARSLARRDLGLLPCTSLPAASNIASTLPVDYRARVCCLVLACLQPAVVPVHHQVNYQVWVCCLASVCLQPAILPVFYQYITGYVSAALHWLACSQQYCQYIISR